MRLVTILRALAVVALFSTPALAREPIAPATRLIASFETGREGFESGVIVQKHTAHGAHSLRLDSGYTSLDARQNWTGFDYLKADLYNDAAVPIDLYVEIRDAKTTGYWTRVNYNTIVPPGKSTFLLPTAIYVGEKSRPGRMLEVANVTRLVFSIGANPRAPLYIDNLRLERDDSAAMALFDGLHAFDFGTDKSPLMDGFTRITPATLYTPEKGCGLNNADVWRAFDVLQPEPLYQDFICIRSGGFAVDVPNGKYHVFVNIDNPSGYWGEYQKYRQRSIIAEGVEVARDTLDFDSFNRKYYRFWNTEDLPENNTFDKYQTAYYDEKEFDVEVKDGRLDLDFKGGGWAVSLSTVIVYPSEKAAEGRAFLDFTTNRRRFHFDNYFKRILPAGTARDFTPTDDDKARGLVFFARDYMKDVDYNDKPRPGELVSELSASSFAGEYEPLTVSVLPLEDLGVAILSVSDLTSGPNIIPTSAVDVGFVSCRLSRVTMEGSVYTIAPRLIMPESSVPMPAGLTRRFWMTVNVPSTAAAGTYTGQLRLKTGKGVTTALPIKLDVFPGTLDPADIPVGPWGHTISTQWYAGPETRKHNDAMARKSLAKIREYGFTSFSGLPVVSYKGFRDGKPLLDFSAGDAQMKRARDAGFTMPVVNYCPFAGLNLYYQDTAAMTAAGFTDYSQFVKAVFTTVQKHADAEGWLPVYWNLGDEPVGDDLTRSAENARAYNKAFAEGPPLFTAATSVRGSDPNDPHLALAAALHVANVNLHDEASIALIHKAGADWAFYNGGNRWTFGTYMYKAVKEFGMKFRLTWHYNVVAGDPYYALDCREDDYAWCNSSPDGTLIPSLRFERLREGLEDYRMMLTLARLAAENPGTPASSAAGKLIVDRLAAFKLGQRNHDAIFPTADYNDFRRRMAEAIAALRR